MINNGTLPNSKLDTYDHQNVYHFKCGITSGTTYPLDDRNVNAILASIGVNLVIGASTIISNLLVMLAIYQTPVLKTPSNYLLMNAAISDFLYGLVCIPLFSTNFLHIYVQESHDCNLFIIMMASIHFFGILSFWILLVVAIDRHIAVFRPYFYHQHISGEGVLKYRYVILSLWAADAIFVTVALGLKTFKVILIFEVASFVFIGGYSFFIHIKIYQQVRLAIKDIHIKQTSRNKKRSKEKQIQLSQNHSTNFYSEKPSEEQMSRYPDTLNSNSEHLSHEQILDKENQTYKTPSKSKHSPNGKISNSKNKSPKNSLKRPLTGHERRVALLTFLMLASMVICYIPYTVVTAAWLSGIDADWTTVLNMWGFTFVSLKSLSNPVIYCYSLESIRKAVERILTKGRIKSQNESALKDQTKR